MGTTTRPPSSPPPPPGIDEARLARLRAQLPAAHGDPIRRGFGRPARPLRLILLALAGSLGVGLGTAVPILGKALWIAIQAALLYEIVRGVRIAGRASAPSVKERLRMERWFATGTILLLSIGWTLPTDFGVVAVVAAVIAVMAYARGLELRAARKGRVQALREPGGRARCRNAERHLDELEALADAIERER